MSIAAAIEFIQSTLRTLPALRAPAYPTGSAIDFPTAFVYEGPGEWSTESADQYKYLGSLIIDMPVPGEDVQSGIQHLRPFIELLPKTILADTSLGGAVATFGTISFTGLIILVQESAGQPALMGYRWTINNMKLRSP